MCGFPARTAPTITLHELILQGIFDSEALRFLEIRLRPKGVGEEGVGEKLNRGFSGFFPWQVREWYVPGPSRHHQIPNFLRTLHIFQQVFSGSFPGFNRVFFRVFKKPGKNLVQFSPTPCMADPFWQSPRNSRNHSPKETVCNVCVFNGKLTCTPSKSVKPCVPNPLRFIHNLGLPSTGLHSALATLQTQGSL